MVRETRLHLRLQVNRYQNSAPMVVLLLLMPAPGRAGYDYSYPVEVSQRGKLFCRNVSNRFGHFTLCLLGMYAVDVNMLLNPKTPFSY